MVKNIDSLHFSDKRLIFRSNNEARKAPAMNSIISLIYINKLRHSLALFSYFIGSFHSALKELYL